MSPDEILQQLRLLTEQKRIEELPLATGVTPLPAYGPARRYVEDLRDGTKPETAAEGLFVSLCKDILDLTPTPQVGLRDGWVDFLMNDKGQRPIAIELKPLFRRGTNDVLDRNDANPGHHKPQIKKYLAEHEYLVFTDLRTAWLCSTRDYFFEEKPFASLPFADFLNQCREARSLTDALRRLEDRTDKPNLEVQFFGDLKNWFGEFEKVRWQPAERTAEFIILLLNKLIFAKTLEDFGLVPYRFIQDEYELRKDRWEAKGAAKVVRHFLSEFEDFFDEYYDTEIFAERIADKLAPEEANYERFCQKLEFVLGLDPWNTAMGRGVVNYNYRRIDEDIFGKSYEMFLAADRKDEGIYYTPAGITTPMADSLVDKLAGPLVDQVCAAVDAKVCDFAQADALLAQVAEIRIADTACGSGGFLIKVLRAFWRQYQRVDDATGWVTRLLKPGNGSLQLDELPPNVQQAQAFRQRHGFDQRCTLIARLLLWHIHGADKDAGALEVAKTNIWKEAVKLSASDYNYRDLKGDTVKILPNLELNFLCGDSLVDVALAKQVAWLGEYHQAELKKLHALRARYIDNPMNHGPLDEALALRRKLNEGLREQFLTENLPTEPAGYALHFWPCWFSPDGTKRTAGGFDGILGNPPWEGFKPVRKEFAAKFHPDKPQFSKLGMDGPAFEQWFTDELKANTEFASRWHAYEAGYERHKEYFARRYQRQGSGDWNLFKLFIESDVDLVRSGGRLSLLVPSGIQTDEGCADLRRWFLSEHRLDELTSFENRGYRALNEQGVEESRHIFPDVDNRFKFGFFKVVKDVPTPPDHAFDARFYLRDPKDAYGPPIRYGVEMVRVFSPANLAFMEFRSGRDYEIGRAIRGEHAFLGDLGYHFRRELHLTGDARFLHKIGAKKLAEGELPLLEGKSIHQFDAKYAPPSWRVDESEVRPELLRKEVFRIADYVREQAPKLFEGKPLPATKTELEEVVRGVFEKRTFKLHYEFERLAYREIGRSTDERTMIAALLPARACFSHKLMYLTPCRYRLGTKGRLEQEVVAGDEVRALLTVMNSLVANFYFRSKVSTGISVHHLYELPVPALKGSARKKLASAADKLQADPRDVAERAALEVLIARDLYGLSRADWEHLTGTFTFGSGESKAELDEIIRQSKESW